jgi:hypothetical protein
MASKTVTKLSRKSAPKVAAKTSKPAIKAALKTAAAAKPAIKAAPKVETKTVVKAAVKPALKTAAKTAALKPIVNKDERIFSHPTMCLHCHLIVEMFHERGADPVKGAWQCPRCAHKYLFSHWKIKRQARSKTEAA